MQSSGGARLEVPSTSSTEPSEPAAPTTETTEPEPGTSVGPGPGPGGGNPGETAPDGVGDALFPDAGNPGLDVGHYDVTLAYDPATDDLAGTVQIDVTLTEAREAITLDIGDDLDITSVELDGTAIEFSVEPPELRLSLGHTFESGSTVRLTVAYTGDPEPLDDSYGLDFGWVDTAGGSFVLNEPNGARTWLPSNDHPSDKATWTFRITVPAGQTAVANGALAEHRTVADGELWVWDQVEPMATYLVLLLTGDYELVEEPAVDGTEIVHAVLAADREAMQPYFELTDDMIRFFEPLFGPYPLDRYGLAMADSYSGLAMETQGRSMFSRDDFASGDPYITELLLSHELAHQWFGDAVTPARWQDIWLNESFATYGQWLWLADGSADAVDEMARAALEQRSFLPGATGEPTESELFGFNVYDGGAVVLHALRKSIGDEAFFATLRSWVAENVGTSRTTDDFIAHVEAANPSLLQTFWADWLYAETVPASYPD